MTCRKCLDLSVPRHPGLPDTDSDSSRSWLSPWTASASVCRGPPGGCLPPWASASVRWPVTAQCVRNPCSGTHTWPAGTLLPSGCPTSGEGLDGGHRQGWPRDGGGPQPVGWAPSPEAGPRALLQPPSAARAGARGPWLGTARLGTAWCCAWPWCTGRAGGRAVFALAAGPDAPAGLEKPGHLAATSQLGVHPVPPMASGHAGQDHTALRGRSPSQAPVLGLRDTGWRGRDGRAMSHGARGPGDSGARMTVPPSPEPGDPGPVWRPRGQVLARGGTLWPPSPPQGRLEAPWSQQQPRGQARPCPQPR